MLVVGLLFAMIGLWLEADNDMAIGTEEDGGEATGPGDPDAAKVALAGVLLPGDAADKNGVASEFGNGLGAILTTFIYGVFLFGTGFEFC